MNIQVPVIGICRHRLYTDGEGVSTLVAFHVARYDAVTALIRKCWSTRKIVSTMIAPRSTTR